MRMLAPGSFFAAVLVSTPRNVAGRSPLLTPGRPPPQAEPHLEPPSREPHPLGIALAGAKEVIDPVVLAAARRVESAYHARASSVWQFACGESGLEPDDLVARLARDQPTLSL